MADLNSSAGPGVTQEPGQAAIRSSFGFGEALRYLENGLRVARTGWNGQ